MHLKTLTSPSPALIQNPNLCRFSRHAVLFNHISSGHLRSSNFPESVKISPARARSCRLITACAKSSEEFREEVEIGKENGGGSVSYVEGSDAVEVAESKGDELMNQSLWSQMKEIVMFSGPATGLWICAPLMSLISTAVIGLGSSTELAALGPGTVFCDNLNLLFMFLSIATSNMVATSLAKKDKQEVQHQISILLFVGLTCGTLMLLFTQLLGPWALTAFAGAKNAHIVPIASKYVQIRGLSWPAVLYGLVAQSASLGMKDSLGPLKALIVASTVNGLGHIVLCTFLRYGIVGAAWATMASQIIASYMMIDALNKKGYNALAVSVPSPKEFLQIFQIAGPVFVTMFSKVAFYSLITYYATAMGTFTVAAHQVMNQTFGMFVVWGEPLSQTAQSFMPEILYGVPRRLDKARMLLKSLVIIGVILGLVIGTTGMSIPWFFPHMFTHDPKVIHEMHRVLILFFLALSITPCTHSLEGTLLAGRELNFISLSMTGCFSFGALLLLIIKGYGLPACWLSLVGFQWGRFFLALQRLTSPNGMLSDGTTRYELGKLKAT